MYGVVIYRFYIDLTAAKLLNIIKIISWDMVLDGL